MKTINIKKANLILAGISILALTSVMLFGIAFSGMTMRSDGTMQDCLFANSPAICPMSVSEHLNLWKSMFTYNLPKTMAMSLSFIAMFLVLAFIYIASVNQSNNLANAVSPALYQKQRNPLLFFDYLKEALSQGIIRPKIY